jgi:hypothetical protein
MDRRHGAASGRSARRSDLIRRADGPRIARAALAATRLELEAGAAAGAGLNGSSMCGFRVTPISGPEE